MLEILRAVLLSSVFLGLAGCLFVPDEGSGGSPDHPYGEVTFHLRGHVMGRAVEADVVDPPVRIVDGSTVYEVSVPGPALTLRWVTYNCDLPSLEDGIEIPVSAYPPGLPDLPDDGWALLLQVVADGVGSDWAAGGYNLGTIWIDPPPPGGVLSCCPEFEVYFSSPDGKTETGRLAGWTTYRDTRF
jgi:hypothetical protein